MTLYPNIYGVIPSPATVTVLTGRGTVSEKCTHGIPMVNPNPGLATHFASMQAFVLLRFM